jgi:hypothetical protein
VERPAPSLRPPQGGGRTVTGPKGYQRHDDYAWARCECDHIVYADDTPGGRCRACSCDNHRPAQREAS